ncbi:MAG: glycosyltransferase family 39 protein [Lentisphaeria bacterium]|nr:glycosyltransferase family 39 protein [Lentisphaeria bacterium]
MSNKSFYTLLIIFTLLISVSVLWDIENHPKGFFLDEASIGYNAYTIGKYGTDEHKISYPVFFRCWGDYQDAVSVYTAVPFVKIWGNEKWTVRIVSAIYHILAALAFAWLIHDFFRLRTLSLIALILFGFSPWIFTLARSLMSGYTPMLLGLCIGITALNKTFRTRSYKWAVVAALGWAFSMYSHNIARPTAFITLLMYVAAHNTTLIKRWKYGLLFSSVLLLLMAPMIVYLLNNPGALTTRFKLISIWYDDPTLSEAIGRIITRYVGYFSFDFLFLTGDSEYRHNTRHGGQMLHVLIPFVILGLIVAVKRAFKSGRYRFVLLAILVYPCAAMLTIDQQHGTRSINGVVYWTFLAIIGIAYFLHRMKSKRAFATSLLMILILAEVSFYMGDYFISYKSYAANSHGNQYGQMIKKLYEINVDNNPVYMSRSVLPYRFRGNTYHPADDIYSLYFGEINPEDYSNWRFKKESGNFVYLGNRKIDGPAYYIKCNGLLLESEGNYLAIENDEAMPYNSELIYSVDLNLYTIKQINSVRNLKSVKLPERFSTGTMTFEIYRIKRKK